MKKPLIMICLGLIALAPLADATSRCEAATFGATGGAMRLAKREKCQDSDQNWFANRANISDVNGMARQLTRCVVETLECRQLLSAAVVPLAPAMGLSDQALAQVVVASARIGPGVYGGTAAGGPVAILPPGTNSPLSVPAYNLTAAAPNSSTVVLNWSGNSDNSMKFIILRQSSGSQDWTNIASIPGGLRTYIDSNVTPGVSYTYRIVTTNRAGGEVSTSNLAAISTRVPPPPVTNLTTTVMNATSVQLNWNDASPDITHFQIQRQLGSTGAWVPLNNAPATARQYTDTTAAASTGYNYRVIAINNFGGAVAANVVSAATAPMLTPGAGFAGPTAQPADTGAPGQLGWGENAIARWDVVPYQTFTGLFNVGVVAFDISGIKEVDFSVNGGPWTAVTKMTLNPQVANHTTIGNPSDGVVEYWTTLNAANFQDGQIEVRAIAVPKAGVPLLLQGSIDSDNTNITGENSLFLYSDAANTLVAPPPIYVSAKSGSDTAGNGSINAPYATLTKAADVAQGGGSILIMDAGTYTLGQGARAAFEKSNTMWITISPVVGLSPQEVVINGNTRPSIEMLKWDNVTFDSLPGYYYNTPSEYTWWNNVIYTDSAGYDDPKSPIVTPVRTSSRTYTTNSTFTNSAYGAANFAMVENCALIKIGGDAFQNSRMVINCTSDTIGGRSDGWHADIIQLFGNPVNNIYYGIIAKNVTNAQGIFHDKTGPIQGEGYRSIAYVDINISGPGTSDGQTQLSSWNTNVLFLNVSDSSWLLFRPASSIPTEQFVGTDVVFINSNWTQTPWNTIALPIGVTVE